MDFEALLEESRTHVGPLGVAFFVVQKALETSGSDPDSLASFASAAKTALSTLSEDDRQLLGFIVDRRVSESPFPGWLRLKSRLTTVEAHIIHDTLLNKGLDARIRREYESAADVLHPAEGVEVWVRPWHLTSARALLEELSASSEHSKACAGCSEESPGHFSSCWNCGSSFSETAESSQE
jgi:hypothetical protein